MLRRYNEAESARLAGMTGASTDAAAPHATVTTGASAEFAVEDVFTITGRGQVATGTVSSGTVRVGDRVVVLRGATEVGTSEVTGIEMFRKKAAEATAGSMAGLLLRGRLEIARGDVIRTGSSA